MNDDDQLMYTQKVETLEPFSSHIVPVRMGKAYVEECINVMIQALQSQDLTSLNMSSTTSAVHACGGGSTSPNSSVRIAFINKQ